MMKNNKRRRRPTQNVENPRTYLSIIFWGGGGVRGGGGGVGVGGVGSGFKDAGLKN